MNHIKNKPSIISLYDKESAVATELRRIVSNLKSVGENKIRSLLVTSATVAEGKSITSCYLGITAASLMQAKVAVIDFDLRKPRIHEYFGIAPDGGLADVLSGKAGIKNVSRSTGIPNLSVITAGKVSSLPTDILDRGDIPALFQELKFYFDFIVIDSPPVIPVSDPLLLADNVDGVLIVIRAGSTQREVVNRAANLLRNAGSNIVGVVLNDYEDVLPYYYKDRYYGYHYSDKKPG